MIYLNKEKEMVNISGFFEISIEKVVLKDGYYIQVYYRNGDTQHLDFFDTKEDAKIFMDWLFNKFARDENWASYKGFEEYKKDLEVAGYLSRC